MSVLPGNSNQSTHKFTRLKRSIFVRLCTAVLFLLALLVGPPPFRLAAQTTTHTVQPGETLSQIAQQHGTTETVLLALNALDEPDTIIVGQQLMVPTTQPTAAPGQHRVQPGVESRV